jgi:hypothetical protein
MPVRIICESAELAVECLRAAQAIGLAIEPEVATDWVQAAARALADGPCAAVCCDAPTLERLVELGHSARANKHTLVLASLAQSADADRLRQVASDLGVSALSEIEPLVSALRLIEAGAQSPWSASMRGLTRADRLRLQPALGEGGRKGEAFARGDAGLLGFSAEPEAAPSTVGAARDVALAVAALRDTDRDGERIELSMHGVDRDAVLDALFGPRRALSDPASKAALIHYEFTMPTEELCASASRAAAEANRIGFPVRISLASPDLRVWDHPDLRVDMVDNAARVRDTFRQLMALAESRLQQVLPDDRRASERLLGVMVTETSEASALLGVRAWPLPRNRVAMEIGFADPHGAAAGDRTLAVLPVPITGIERVLRRLQGSALLLGGTAAQRKLHIEAIGDVLLRVSAFVHELREQVESVELRPLALLLDGSVELREACVTVSDAFERSLSAPPAPSAAVR